MITEFPPVAELIPHDGNMVLLSEVLEHSEGETVCALEVGPGPFVEASGRVGSWVGIELMSQCIAAHGGLLAFAMGKSPKVGLLLGSRRVRFLRGHFEVGEKMIARAIPVWGKEAGFVAFDCTLTCADTGDLYAEGRLNCFLTSSSVVDMLEGGGI
jgi:predicted hotdog family 3-hydroxylacyl-ACP dehydratase